MTAHPSEEWLPAFTAGTLPLELSTELQAHLAECADCRLALEEWWTIRAGAQGLAADTPAPSRALLERTLAQIDAMPSASPRWYERLLTRPLARRTLVGVVAAAMLALVFVITPLGSYAENVFQTFQPKQFAVVPVTLADLQALPSLSSYGDLSEGTKSEPQLVGSVAEASTASGITVLVPSVLPAAVTAPPRYLVMSGDAATFTFRAAKAQASAQGKTLPPMPHDIDGSAVTITTGNAVATVYGGSPAGGNPEGPAASNAPGNGLPALGADVPQLLIAQMTAPLATATGAPVTELERYLLSMPGISDHLANAIRAIGDPTVTWPIPVPLGKVNTHSATVAGTPATVFNEASGFASGVVWVKDGVINVVAGPLSEKDALRVAGSLH